ncbi:hypothetical protein HBI32_142780 [Parastagonospora nodorum]|nr:hypothetical protein HBI32_142780 [Parastagonospora nodorum]
MPSVTFIPNVYIADSLRARTLINLSAVLNIDLNFVLSVAFISNVHIANSLRTRTLINLSIVLYEQAAAQTSLPAKVSNISLRARTLINLSAVLYEQADAQFSLSAEVSIIDLNFVPGVAFDAIENIELTGNLLGDVDCVNNNNNNIVLTLQFSLTALLNLQSLASKRPASSNSDLNCRRTNLTIASQILLVKQLHNLVRDNIEELICISKVKHTYVQAYTIPYSNLKKYLSNSTENLFTQQELTPRELGSIYVLQIISKSDKVPTQELSSYIKTELLRDNSYKFYYLVITSKDTHYKQIIKKAYIISPERALLILFII